MVSVRSADVVGPYLNPPDNGYRVPVGRDSLGLLDDDPRLQLFAQLLAELLLLAQLSGADQVSLPPGY